MQQGGHIAAGEHRVGEPLAELVGATKQHEVRAHEALVHGFGHLHESRLAMKRDQGELDPLGRGDHRVGELAAVQKPQFHRDRGDLLLVELADEASLGSRLEADSESVVEDEFPALQQPADLRDVKDVSPTHLAIQVRLAGHHLGQPTAHDREVEDVGDREHARIVSLVTTVRHCRDRGFDGASLARAREAPGSRRTGPFAPLLARTVVLVPSRVRRPLAQPGGFEAEQLHVLLRHRLLRQPGGFEGVLAVKKYFEAGGSAFLDGPDVAMERLTGTPLSRPTACPMMSARTRPSGIWRTSSTSHH